AAVGATRASSRRGKTWDQRRRPVQDIPEHLFELVLLRLDSSLWLIRAAAVCLRWRRAGADAGFLRLFRTLHPPHVIGHCYTVDPYYDMPPRSSSPGMAECGGCVFVPASSSSPPAFVGGRRFSLGFLPDSKSWELVDCRGSLLLSRKETCWVARMRPLLVCEPTTGRYQGILRPTGLNGRSLGMFLLDGVQPDGGCINMSNFRIMCAMYTFNIWHHDRETPFACVFSSGSDGGWRVVDHAGDIVLPFPGKINSLNFVGRANGSVYWEIDGDAAVLALGEAGTGFSRVLFPENVRASHCERTLRVMAGADDGAALRVVRVIGSELKVFARLPGGSSGAGDEWMQEKLLSLPEATRGLPGHEERFFQGAAMIVDANASYVLVTPSEKTWLFSVDLETMVAERDHHRNRFAGAAQACELPWPPALQACCADRGRGRRRCPSS
ncbi:hypothetical protein BRADI_4g28081v3, partial [Brachypodium distachyon]